MYGSSASDNPVWGEAHMSTIFGGKCQPSEKQHICPEPLKIYLHVGTSKTHTCGATLHISHISPASKSKSQQSCFKDYKKRCFDTHKNSAPGPHVAVSSDWLARHGNTSNKKLPAHFTFQRLRPAESKGKCLIKRRLEDALYDPANANSAAHRRLQNDPAFIHKGCSAKKGLRPVYTDGPHGRAWYCSDRKACGGLYHLNGPLALVQDQCDAAAIHSGCAHSKGLKPKYDHNTKAWVCSDALPSATPYGEKICPKLTPCAAYAKHGVHFGPPRCHADGSHCALGDAFIMYGSTPADNPVWGEAHMSIGMTTDQPHKTCKPGCALEIRLHVKKVDRWDCGATLRIDGISPAKTSQHLCFRDYKARCFDHFKGKHTGPHVAVSNKWLERHSDSGKRLPAHFTFQTMKPAESKGKCHISRRLDDELYRW